MARTRGFSNLPNPFPLDLPAKPPPRKPRPRGKPPTPPGPWKPPYKPGPRPKFPFGRLPPPPPPLPPPLVGPRLGRLFGRLLGPFGWLLLLYDAYELYQWYKKPGENYAMPSGWTCHRVCNTLEVNLMDGIAPISNCSIVQCDAGNRPPTGFTIAPNAQMFKLYNGTPSGLIPGWIRFITVEIYEYATAPDPLPDGIIRPAPAIAVPLPEPLMYIPPWIDPNYLPIHQPVPQFRPPPFPFPPQPSWWRPVGDPTPLPENAPWPVPPNPAYPPFPWEGLPARDPKPLGPGAAPARPAPPVAPWKPPLVPGPIQPIPKPRPGALPLPLPQVPPVPYVPTAPWQEPVWDWEIKPEPDPRFPTTRPPRPAPHARRPPRPRREKERKRRSAAAGLLWWAANMITESTDYIKAAYNALPWKVRRFKGKNGKWMDKDITPQDRLNRIHDHIEDLDIYEFAKNVAINNLQDAALGKASQQIQKLNGLLSKYGYDRPVGIETGPQL